MTSKSRIVNTIGKILNPDEGGSNEQDLPSTQRETSQSRQSVSQLNQDTDFMVAKQILCKTRVCVALFHPIFVLLPQSSHPPDFVNFFLDHHRFSTSSANPFFSVF
jgi:hypothetical protein